MIYNLIPLKVSFTCHFRMCFNLLIRELALQKLIYVYAIYIKLNTCFVAWVSLISLLW